MRDDPPLCLCLKRPCRPLLEQARERLERGRLQRRGLGQRTRPFGHGLGGVRTEWTSAHIWIRRTATLPAVIPAQLDVLLKHDEDAEVYVNGVLAASQGGYNDEYSAIAMSAEGRQALRPGANVIAVHCHQTSGGQGVDVGIAAHP